MRNTLLIVLLMLLCSAAKAQRFLSEVFPSVTKTSNITYATNFQVLTGTHVSVPLRMDVYEPAGIVDTMARRPLIIFLHSGSFLPPYLNTQLDGGRNDSGIVWMCQSFARRGYVVANIDYRLGWSATSSVEEIRRGTLIKAFIRAVQDVKACARYFRKDAGTTNMYRIDSNRVIVGGLATGGALAVNYAALTNKSQLSIPKFISSINDGPNRFTAGEPFVIDTIMGDLDGYGGNPLYNNSNNSPGYNGRANFIFSWEAIVGDKSWIVSGLPPMVSFHRQKTSFTQPYGDGIVYVNIGGLQPVVPVSGSGVFIPLHNTSGNNACFSPNNFTDPYTQKAMALSGGQEGLYPILVDTNNYPTWYDSTSSVSECLLYGLIPAQCNGIYASYYQPGNKSRALPALDTIMGYLNPRIVKCLYPTGVGVGGPVAEERDVHIYPNPAGGDITIDALGTGNNILAVVVRDITGKAVQQLANLHQQKLTLHLNGAAAGLYLVTVITDKRISSQRLVVKQ